MISIPQLQQTLSNLYDLKCFVDLAELTTSPNGAYKYVNHCHQEKFNNNDRLVFYTSEIIPNSLLQHLYQATGLIDISNYFVLICSTHDVTQQVTDIAKLNTTTPFQTTQLLFENCKSLQNNFAVPDTLCPLPWRHLEVGPSGEIRPCCVYTDNVGHVKNDSLKNTFNNRALQNLRQELLSGKRSSGCNKCWENEKNGLTSNRHYHMRMLKKELLTKDLDNPAIKSLDIKPGNTCNFKCRICSPVYSSLYAQEVKSNTGISIESFNWAESDSRVIDEIVELLPTLTNIDMYGGEPFLIKPLLRVVKQAVDQHRAPHIRLHYNSNGSVYPETLIEYWKKFNHVDIQFSIDNIGNRFELERGGSWQQVDSNIKKLIALDLPNVKISVMPAISIMNVFYLDSVLQWANDLGLAINVQYVTRPSEFDLKNLTADAKKLIVEKFQHHPWPEMKNILSYIMSIPDSDGQEFLKLCRHFDMLRNQNFAETHTELAKVMGYVYNNNI
jgi:radical SAM protein with 4Fe4S-binding SPASM domain